MNSTAAAATFSGSRVSALFGARESKLIRKGAVGAVSVRRMSSLVRPGLSRGEFGGGRPDLAHQTSGDVQGLQEARSSTLTTTAAGRRAW